MKKNLHHVPFNLTAALLSVLFGMLIIILYLGRSSPLLPPNGTVIHQPSLTPNPTPKIIPSGIYANKELGVMITIPNSVVATETVEPDDWLKVKITQKTGQKSTMVITRRKRIVGYEGQGKYTCDPILVDGNQLVLFGQKVKRCQLNENDLISYDVSISYPDKENPLSIGVYYEFDNYPSEVEFKFFDKILSTISSY